MNKFLTSLKQVATFSQGTLCSEHVSPTWSMGYDRAINGKSVGVQEGDGYA